MANTYAPTGSQIKAWNKWLRDRPAKVRLVAEKFPPWKLFRIASTGQRVTVYSVNEAKDSDDVTLTVSVLAKYNLVQFERNVFGISPDDLVECELPADSEQLGAALTQDQVQDNIDDLRLTIRPDLWTRDEATGKAVPLHRN